MITRNKKTSEEIKSDILSQLKDGPKTTSEIGENINSNWLTVEKFLKELKEKGEVMAIISSQKMKVYRRTDDLTYYGLPFSKEIRDRSSSLLFTIARRWKNETGTYPSRTMLQKVAVELIEDSNEQLRDIPILRFHYGQILAVRYDESFKKDYKILNLTPKQDLALSELINKYKNFSSGKAQLEQYKKESMKFYYEKEANLIKTFSDKDYDNIEKSLLKLSVYYPDELKETFELFDKFTYCSVILLNLTDEKEKLEALNKIKEVFYLLWDTITTNCFFYDSERHILEDKKELFNQIKSNVLNSKISNVYSVLEDLKSEVDSINPANLKISDSDKSKEFIHELLED